MEKVSGSYNVWNVSALFANMEGARRAIDALQHARRAGAQIESGAQDEPRGLAIGHTTCRDGSRRRDVRTGALACWSAVHTRTSRVTTTHGRGRLGHALFACTDCEPPTVTYEANRFVIVSGLHSAVRPWPWQLMLLPSTMSFSVIMPSAAMNESIFGTLTSWLTSWSST